MSTLSLLCSCSTDDGWGRPTVHGRVQAPELTPLPPEIDPEVQRREAELAERKRLELLAQNQPSPQQQTQFSQVQPQQQEAVVSQVQPQQQEAVVSQVQPQQQEAVVSQVQPQQETATQIQPQQPLIVEKPIKPETPTVVIAPPIRPEANTPKVEPQTTQTIVKQPTETIKVQTEHTGVSQAQPQPIAQQQVEIAKRPEEPKPVQTISKTVVPPPAPRPEAKPVTEPAPRPVYTEQQKKRYPVMPGQNRGLKLRD
ncbi:MAG: hypothetical protein IKZ07_04175 [Akkermansia sp.]|nr:hypothetical protein [Akkermansia sp.]